MILILPKSCNDHHALVSPCAIITTMPSLELDPSNSIPPIQNFLPYSPSTYMPALLYRAHLCSAVLLSLHDTVFVVKICIQFWPTVTMSESIKACHVTMDSRTHGHHGFKRIWTLFILLVSYEGYTHSCMGKVLLATKNAPSIVWNRWDTPPFSRMGQMALEIS